MLRSIAIMFLVYGQASLAEDSLTAVDLTITHGVKPDVIYHRADGMDLKVDVYAPNINLWGTPEQKKPVPTVVYFHGGGWWKRSKAVAPPLVQPYLAKGWAAVAVQYRLAGEALAPAAVEDARCAVWWVKRHAEEYGFDSDQVILSGHSAGGHLALITGMLPASAGLDRLCPNRHNKSGPRHADASLPELKVAAVINWGGIADVEAIIDGPDMKAFAVTWLGSWEDRAAVARRVSPVQYVRQGLPPILTLHGENDEVAPFKHAVKLHKRLDAVGAPNFLHVIKGREHFADYTVEDAREGYRIIDRFPQKYLK